MFRRAGIDHKERKMNSKEGGFTLIEVLFAVIFLSIGLLGIAAMQDIAISRNVDGRRLTVATNLAAEMLERVRYNAAGNSQSLVGQYLYNGIIACVPGPNCAAANPGNTIPTPLPRSGQVTAFGDYNQWSAALAAVDSNGVPLLPGARGTVTVVPVNPLNAIGPSSLELVQTTVTVGWLAGLRTPTVTMSSVMAPL